MPKDNKIDDIFDSNNYYFKRPFVHITIPGNRYKIKQYNQRYHGQRKICKNCHCANNLQNDHCDHCSIFFDKTNTYKMEERRKEQKRINQRKARLRKSLEEPF